MRTKLLLGLLAGLLLMAVSVFANAKDRFDMVVAKDGSGNYTSVQAAINAAPGGRRSPFKIFVKSGVYTEQIIIPAEKTFIELVGEDVATTVIGFGDGKGGTSAFTINADDCMLMNLTLQNTQGAIADGPQSLALRTNANHAVFYNCRFISGQDTVLVSKAGAGIYFKDCYIDGNTDFIYGASVGVFDNCVIFCRDRVDWGRGGYLTAANTPAGQRYGLVFRNCLIPQNHGITMYTLGRPWQNDAGTEAAGRKRAENKVVFLKTRMSNVITPQGWSVWNEGTVTNVITYAEYKTTDLDGKPTDVSKRLPWTKQLTDSEAAPYFVNSELFGHWDPFKTWADLPKETAVPALTINNFIARNINNNTVLQFNSSNAIAGVNYKLYRAESSNGNCKQIGELTTTNNTDVAFQFKDKLPAEGQVWYYQLKATNNKANVVSDTLGVNLGNINTPKSRAKK